MGKKARTRSTKRQVRRIKEQVEEQLRLPIVDVLLDLKETLRDTVVSAGMQVVTAMLEQDRDTLCGPKNARRPNREMGRGGTVRGELVLGGRRVAIHRPRVHQVKGGAGSEVPLPTFERFADEDPLNERAVEQMLIGVSTRKYERSLEDVPPAIETRGTSKSAVSRRFVARTQAELDSWMKRPLGDLEIVALFIDGIGFGEHTVVVAMGVDATGKKHVLAFREGTTENTVLCASMLKDIVARGLPPDRALLVVIDGGKGAHAGVREVFGQYAVIQRCRVHKKRNILGHLPKHMHDTARTAMNRAYSLTDKKKARDVLLRFASSVEQSHPSAAESVREGLDETLTILDLGLGATLGRSLSSTNAIENIFSTVRRISNRVDRWRGGRMALRWALAGMQEAAKKFRRLMGCADMPRLIAALRRHDRQVASAA